MGSISKRLLFNTGSDTQKHLTPLLGPSLSNPLIMGSQEDDPDFPFKVPRKSELKRSWKMNHSSHSDINSKMQSHLLKTKTDGDKESKSSSSDLCHRTISTENYEGLEQP